jgi:tRNA(fMet)-specific endonuclease VapC
MANKVVLADTSILIDFFRKTDKAKSGLILLYRQGYDFSISAVTEFEIYSGATVAQIPFWQNLLENTEVIPFDKKAVTAAISINKKLKLKRKQIEIADLFIAATAIANNLPFATLNKKHFERIENLQILE